MEKEELRSRIRQRKRAMSLEEIREKSDRLAALLFALPVYQKASTLYGYLSYNQEVRTDGILRRAMQDGKKVAVPKVYGQTMRFLYLTDLTRVAKGYGGIAEPIDDAPIADAPTALVLLPGLAFDTLGRRCGYGGGFYDRFLAQEPNHPTVALCYDFQLVPEVPAGENDVPADCVLWA